MKGLTGQIGVHSCPSRDYCAGYKWIGLFFSGTDFVTCLVFLIVVAVIHDRLFSVSLQVDGANIKASDYSVLVRGLPRNVTSGEVLEHFNGLYDLGKDDWTFEGYRCWFGRKTTQRAVENTRARAAAKVPVIEHVSWGPKQSLANSVLCRLPQQTWQRMKSSLESREKAQQAMPVLQAWLKIRTRERRGSSGTASRTVWKLGLS
jgi:hypothetical protein